MCRDGDFHKSEREMCELLWDIVRCRTFFLAYVTEIGLPARYCPFIAAMAASDDSKES